MSGTDQEQDKKKRVIVGCTGSVASIKIPLLIQELKNLNEKVEIKVVATDHALHFFNKDSLPVPVLTDNHEWEMWKSVQDPVLHIELRRWADMLVIAPVDCNTLAKIANGLCDNLLTCIVRAWDLNKPLYFAPAMNTYMWEHPITAQQIETLKNYGYKEIPCIEKKLACGDTGFGAMAEVSTIVGYIKEALNLT
ncbi:phosphopantothenoylcysteine decarboxylase-like [Saccostrea echinata]|uniref:phosphopantothenoylcysteine decarboxylase-like n=1 Tax=Saccostrea echinata TaxID=191078 RepID=UPI002A824E94|nr:phosphopantothenoylcysteine decarboxylase-like [Saccostrea echinata]